MKFSRFGGLLAAAALGIVMMQSVAARAESVSYVDWTSGTAGEPGTVTGTLFSGANQITVTYTGDVSFFNSGDSPVHYSDPSDYTAGGTIAAPPYTGLIGLAVDGVDTLTFSQAVTDPILDVVSLGAPGNATTYAFNATPIILSQGTDQWGGVSGDLTVSGNTLFGQEGSGAVQFDGTYTSISWTAGNQEYWNAITVGAPSPTPEPGSLVLLGSGLLFLAFVMFRSAKPAGFSMQL